jgi:hypothetical protein
MNPDSAVIEVRARSTSISCWFLKRWFKTFNRFAPFNRRAERFRSKRFERLERKRSD